MRRAAAIALATAPAAAAIVAPHALAATPASPPTISSAFTPALITVGSTTALSITITNPNTSSLSGIAVTDNLPSGLVVDNPNGQSGTCGSSGVLIAEPGVAQISLTGGSLSAGASCTISADVTASATGAHANSTGPVAYTGGSTSGTGDTETLTVVGEPAITITSPARHAVFTLGQKVDATYNCADPSGAPPITGCIGDA